MIEESNWLLGELQRIGAILTDDHFVYTSGKHGSAYVNKDAVYTHVRLLESIGHMMVLKNHPIESEFHPDVPDVIVGPAMGGILLASYTALAYASVQRDVAAVYAEKLGGEFTFTRGYDALVRGQRVLVVEDVITTGGSVKKVVDLVRATQGIVMGVVALCLRGNVTALDLGVNFLKPLLRIPLQAWPEAECPLCAQAVPINTAVGKGKEFLARQGK